MSFAELLYQQMQNQMANAVPQGKLINLSFRLRNIDCKVCLCVQDS